MFGQIAANHALSDIYAMNGTPVSALALAVLPYGPEDMVEDHLVHLLAGALLVLAREECALVGGHTSEGAETALGLAIHGTVHPSAALHKSLLVRDVRAVGDQELVLILTKGLCLLSQHILSLRPINTPFHDILSPHPVNIPYQHTLPIRALTHSLSQSILPPPLSHPLHTLFHPLHTLFAHPSPTPFTPTHTHPPPSHDHLLSKVWGQGP